MWLKLFKSPSATCWLGHRGALTELLPSCRWLRNCSYSNNNNSSHIRVTLPPVPCPGPTTPWIDYTPAYYLTPFTDHIWAVSQFAPQLYTARDVFTPWWNISLLSPGRLSLGDITALRPPYADPYSPQSVWPPNGGIPQALLTFIPSPPSTSYHRVITYVTPTYREFSAPALLLMSLSSPSPPSPIKAVLYGGSGKSLPSWCC